MHPEHLTQLREALEIGLDARAAEAAQYHAAMKGYRLYEHERHDAEVAKIEAALFLLDQQQEQPSYSAQAATGDAPTDAELVAALREDLEQWEGSHCGGDCLAAACDHCDGTQHKPGAKWLATKTDTYAEGLRDGAAEMGWRPIADGLPGLGESVALLDTRRWENTADQERNVQAAGYLADLFGMKYWSVRGEPALEIDAFTHWLPLPSAPDALNGQDQGTSPNSGNPVSAPVASLPPVVDAGWIAVEDRMPDDDAEVLLYIPDGQGGGCIQIDRWWERAEETVVIGFSFDNYGFWMPLPPPPVDGAEPSKEKT